MKRWMILFSGLGLTGFLYASDDLGHGRWSSGKRLDDALLDSLRQEARTHHPAVMAARSRAAAAQHEVHAIRRWEDPMVDIGMMRAPRMMRMDDGDLMLGLEQALPKPGLYDAMRSQMSSMGKAENGKLAAAELQVSASAAGAAIQLAMHDEVVMLQQAQIDWMQEMVSNAKQMALDPMGNSSDALRMEAELLKEQQMLDSSVRRREAAAQQLNLILGRPVDTAWPTLRLPEKALPVPLAASEIARVARVNPELKAMQEMANAADAAVQVAQKEKFPMISVGVQNQRYAASNESVSTTYGIKLTLPWFNDGAYDSDIDAAKQRKTSADHEVDAMQRMLAERVSMLTTEIANAAAEAQAYGTEVLAKAELAAKSAEAAWISQRAPLNDVLDASRALYGIRLDERRMIAMQMIAMEELKAVVP